MRFVVHARRAGGVSDLRKPQDVERALFTLNLSGIEFRVVLAILYAQYQFGRDGRAEQPIKLCEFVAEAELIERSVIRALDRLESRGIIRRTRGGGKSKASLYAVNPPAAWLSLTPATVKALGPVPREEPESASPISDTGVGDGLTPASEYGGPYSDKPESGEAAPLIYPPSKHVSQARPSTSIAAHSPQRAIEPTSPSPVRQSKLKRVKEPSKAEELAEMRRHLEQTRAGTDR